MRSCGRAKDAIAELARVRVPHPVQEIAWKHDLNRVRLVGRQGFGPLVSHQYWHSVRQRYLVCFERTFQSTAAIGG